MTFTADTGLKCVRVAAKQQQREPGRGRRLWDGRRIEELRTALGKDVWTQTYLAELSGVSEGDISRHENNSPLSNPSIDALGLIAIAMDIPLAVLVSDYGSPILQTATYQQFCERMLSTEFRDMDDHKVFTYPKNTELMSADPHTLGRDGNGPHAQDDTAQLVPQASSHDDWARSELPSTAEDRLVKAVRSVEHAGLSIEKAATALASTAGYLKTVADQLHDTLQKSQHGRQTPSTRPRARKRHKTPKRAG